MAVAWRTGLCLAALVLAAGCGRPDPVTFTDPNPGGVYSTDGVTAQPLARYGADTYERTLAVMRMRARLIAIRALITGGDAGAGVGSRTHAGDALEQDFAVFEPQLMVRAPGTAERIRRDLESMASTSPSGVQRQVRRVDELGALLAGEVRDLVAGRAADQPDFRSAVLAGVLETAAVAWEEAHADPAVPAVEHPYQLAWGLLLLAGTEDLLASLPPRARTDLDRRLDRLMARSVPGPSPAGEAPRDAAANPERVAERIYAAYDLVLASANIDTSPPEPDQGVVEALELAQQAVTDVGATYTPDDPAQAQGHLLEARRRLEEAAPAVAAVDIASLVSAEEALLAELVPLVRERAPAGSVAASAERASRALAEARSAVQDELAAMAQ